METKDASVSLEKKSVSLTRSGSSKRRSSSSNIARRKSSSSSSAFSYRHLRQSNTFRSHSCNDVVTEEKRKDDVLSTVTSDEGEGGEDQHSGGRTGGGVGGKLYRPGFTWQIGNRLEAKDFMNVWYSAKIVDLDDVKKSVLIHFDGWNQRYDEWLPMDSERLRPLTRHSGRKKSHRNSPSKSVYKAGDNVYARWSDCRMYPAKIVTVNSNGSYEVMFDDGIKKTVQSINIDTKPSVLQPSLGEHITSPSDLGKKTKPLSPTSIRDLTGKNRYNRDAFVGLFRFNEKLKTSRKLRGCSVRVKRCCTKEEEQDDSEIPKKRNTSISLSEVQPQATETITESLTETQTDVGDELKEQQEQLEDPLVKRRLIHVKAVHGRSKKSTNSVLPADSKPEEQTQLHCPHSDCSKAFRNSTLLQYHIKYYHLENKTESTQQQQTTSVDTVPNEEVTAYNNKDMIRRIGIVRKIRRKADNRYKIKKKVVNCVCHGNKGNSPMIQCTLCLCWQHKQCIEEETETNSTKRYICKICRNPPGVRANVRYSFDPDWLVEGNLSQYELSSAETYGSSKAKVMKVTHQLVADLLAIRRVIDSVNRRIFIVKEKIEPEYSQVAVDQLNNCHLQSVKEKQCLSSTTLKNKQDHENADTTDGSKLVENKDFDLLSSEGFQENKFNAPIEDEKQAENRPNTGTGNSGAECNSTAVQKSYEGVLVGKGDQASTCEHYREDTTKCSRCNIQNDGKLKTYNNQGTHQLSDVKEIYLSTSLENGSDLSMNLSGNNSHQMDASENNQLTGDTSASEYATSSQLLEYINQMHDDIEKALGIIEEQVTTLESGEGNVMCYEDVLRDLPRVKKTTNQLITDLNKIQHAWLYQ